MLSWENMCALISLTTLKLRSSGAQPSLTLESAAAALMNCPKWHQRDAAAAEAWIENSDRLSDIERSSLLKKVRAE